MSTLGWVATGDSVVKKKERSGVIIITPRWEQKQRAERVFLLFIHLLLFSFLCRHTPIGAPHPSRQRMAPNTYPLIPHNTHQSTSIRKSYIQNLTDLLHVCLLRGEVERAQRAWAILVCVARVTLLYQHNNGLTSADKMP
jgi:hypothetical protein